MGMKIKKTVAKSFYKPRLLFNTSYLTDSYIGFTLKVEFVTKNTIFGLKMMVKNSLPCGKIIIFITEFVILDTFMK